LKRRRCYQPSGPQGAGGAGHFYIAGFGSANLQREKEILLGREQIRTVDREQRITGPNRFANGICKDFFDVPRDLAVDVCEVSFVVRHLAHDSNLFR